MALSKPSTSSSKIKDSLRTFHEQWETKYLFTESKARKPVCLICSATVAVAKKYNLERHFKQNHSKFEKEYPTGSAIRTEFIKKKKNQLFSQQNIFVKRHEDLESMVKTSYEISLLLAKKKKPFSDGEIIKQSLLIFAQNCDDQKVKVMADSVSLSRNTVMRRVEDMSSDINSQITEYVTKCKYFSLALDETCDLTGMAQLAIFVRCIDDNFTIFQDLLDLCQLETTTTGKDIFMKLKDCVEGKKLNWDKCNSVCTDGAPAMIGKTNGVVTLLQNHAGRQLFSYHCIIHQEALCAKDMMYEDVIDPVVRCINFIRARALNRRQFRRLFEEEIKEYGELHLYCAVRWLSKGEMLKHFYDLRQEVLEFLEEKEALPTERVLLKNSSWLCDLAFLIDTLHYLNVLNLKLQGKDCSLPTMFNLINGFKGKLDLFAANLAKNKIDHFPTLASVKEELKITVLDIQKYLSKIRSLKDSFDNRFKDFESDKLQIKLFINPFAISSTHLLEYPANIQLEVTDIQNHTALKQIFYENVSSEQLTESFASFWKNVSREDFPILRDISMQILSRFGSTYVCEKTFSTLSYIKNKYRTSLTAKHISDLILLSSSDLNPNIDKLLSEKPLHSSH